MSNPTQPIKRVLLEPGESFTIQVSEFGDNREVFVWLQDDGTLSFNDEHAVDRKGGRVECVVLDQEAGWIPYDGTGRKGS